MKRTGDGYMMAEAVLGMLVGRVFLSGMLG